MPVYLFEIDTHGGVGIAHNDAGIEGNTDPLAEQTEEDWNSTADIDLYDV
ncbi:hypothetical protein [Salinigranum marinum]|nr:hypothetical protein [Salinigranum marinum]